MKQKKHIPFKTDEDSQENLLEIVGESFEEWRGKKQKFKVKNGGEEKMNEMGDRWNLYGSFTDGFTDGYKINYYFNLFHQ